MEPREIEGGRGEGEDRERAMEREGEREREREREGGVSKRGLTSRDEMHTRPLDVYVTSSMCGRRVGKAAREE